LRVYVEHARSNFRLNDKFEQRLSRSIVHLRESRWRSCSWALITISITVEPLAPGFALKPNAVFG